MKNNRPLITIIVPVYNTSEYLSDCVDSILNQSYENLEIILINDGSTDNSGRICDDYQKIDSRIVVLHKQNQGLSKTRSLGIEIAHGDYIMFVDSDDWIDTTMCEAMIDVMGRYRVQSVMCSYIREYPGKSLPKTVLQRDTVIDSCLLLRRLCGPLGEELRHPENLDNFNTMWGKLYPAAALKGISLIDFKVIGPSEDLMFNLDSFTNIDSMVYIDQPFYHYRKGMPTSISGAYKHELEGQWDNLYNMILDIIHINQMEGCYVSALNNRIALNVLGLGLNCIHGDVSHLEKCKRLHRIVTNPRRKTALKQLPLKYMPMHWKLFYFSAKHRFIIMLYVLLLAIEKLKGRV